MGVRVLLVSSQLSEGRTGTRGVSWKRADVGSAETRAVARSPPRFFRAFWHILSPGPFSPKQSCSLLPSLFHSVRAGQWCTSRSMAKGNLPCSTRVPSWNRVESPAELFQYTQRVAAAVSAHPVPHLRP